MFGLPSVHDKQDPANKMLAMVAIIVAPVLVLLVVFVQQFMLNLNSLTVDEAPRSVLESEMIDDPGIDHYTLEMKAALKEKYFLETLDEPPPPPRRGGRGKPVPEAEPDEQVIIDEVPILEFIDEISVTRTERLRGAIVAGDVAGKDAAIERLTALQKEAEPGGALAGHTHWLLKLYKEGPGVLTDEARQSLVDHHGWFGELALTFGTPPTSSARQDLLGGFDRLMALFIGYYLFIGLTFLIGIALAVTALIMLNNGDLTGEFDAPAFGGPVYLEAYCLFLLGFAVTVFIQIPFRTSSASTVAAGIALSQVLTWGLFGAAFWPLARGVRWDELRIDLGLHTGAGVGREMWIGCLAFAAERPVLWLVNVIYEFMHYIFSATQAASEPAGTDKFPLYEAPLSNAWWLLWLGALGSVIWAPFFEELIYRGCLYRVLHARLRWPATVLVTAFAFAVIHPYGLDGMIQVFVAGLTFGLLREWRGSLIACITCHMLHNGTIEFMSIAATRILDS